MIATDGPAGRPTDLGSPLAGRHRVARDLVRGLGHSVGLEHRRAERGLEGAHHRGRQRRGRRPHEAKAVRGVAFRMARQFGQHRLMNRRRRRVPRRLQLVDPRHERAVAVAGAARHAAPGGERGEERGDEAVNVEERHHVERAVGRRKLQCADDVAGRRAQVAVRQRDELRSRRRSRRVQQERDVVRSGARSTLVGAS